MNIYHNEAQAVRFALGIEFPLYAVKSSGRNEHCTKRGPGRRAPTTPVERLLRHIKRNTTTGASSVRVQVHLPYIAGVKTAPMYVFKRGVYSVFRKGVKLFMHMGRGRTGSVIIPHEFA